MDKALQKKDQRRSSEQEAGFPPTGAYRLDIYLSVGHPDYAALENQFFINQATHDRMRTRPRFMDELRGEHTRVLEALRQGKDAAVFDALRLHGLLVLRTGDGLDNEFGEFRRLAWARISSWYDEARVGPTRQKREAAIRRLRRLVNAFVPERRGRKRPEERIIARDVYEYYYRYLFRLMRARQLLRDWPWPGRERDRVNCVARACDVEASHLAPFSTTGDDHALRPLPLKLAAKTSAARAFGITPEHVQNYLSLVPRKAFRLGQPIPARSRWK